MEKADYSRKINKTGRDFLERPVLVPNCKVETPKFIQSFIHSCIHPSPSSFVRSFLPSFVGFRRLPTINYLSILWKQKLIMALLAFSSFGTTSLPELFPFFFFFLPELFPCKVGRGSILQGKIFGNKISLRLRSWCWIYQMNYPIFVLPRCQYGKLSQGSRFLKTLSNRRQIDILKNKDNILHWNVL